MTAQNFELPTRIAGFVNDIFASYSLVSPVQSNPVPRSWLTNSPQLNLRNDALRRKFDSLKYDLKRCEDVVYDLTLRGLVKAPASA